MFKIKIKIQGEKLLFENFPFKTKEVGISFLYSGISIWDNPDKGQMKIMVKDGICTNQKVADVILGYTKGIPEASFTQTPAGTYVCNTNSITENNPLN